MFSPRQRLMHDLRLAKTKLTLVAVIFRDTCTLNEHSEASDRIAIPGNAKKYRTVHAFGRRKRKGRGRKSTKSSEPLVDSDERCVDAPRPFRDGATERVASDDDDGEANSGRLRIDAKVVTNAEVEENHAREKATLDRLSSAPATARKIDFSPRVVARQPHRTRTTLLLICLCI
ncbi:hypothetical protein HPB51_012323 [Rhipicephalus microplus]|uniref:Uncharacterized protein n=1 Tax=Rhipicephalus microplus TaxID=6941 RepID=A0A9J6D9R3_RHIMP|nr:hypothetical protein HPB51_012323 [Rhipicephalus microplus]